MAQESAGLGVQLPQASQLFRRPLASRSLSGPAPLERGCKSASLGLKGVHPCQAFEHRVKSTGLTAKTIYKTMCNTVKAPVYAPAGAGCHAGRACGVRGGFGGDQQTQDSCEEGCQRAPGPAAQSEAQVRAWMCSALFWQTRDLASAQLCLSCTRHVPLVDFKLQR